jgi:hypothetical protein
MSNQTTLVQNDTGPNVYLTLTDKSTGLAVDLTSATITMAWRALNTTALLPTAGMFLAPQSPYTTGVIEIVWGTQALFNPPGWYEGQITIAQGGINMSIVMPLRVLLIAKF